MHWGGNLRYCWVVSGTVCSSSLASFFYPFCITWRPCCGLATFWCRSDLDPTFCFNAGLNFDPDPNLKSPGRGELLSMFLKVVNWSNRLYSYDKIVPSDSSLPPLRNCRVLNAGYNEEAGTGNSERSLACLAFANPYMFPSSFFVSTYR